jgi:hypothetical protein
MALDMKRMHHFAAGLLAAAMLGIGAGAVTRAAVPAMQPPPDAAPEQPPGAGMLTIGLPCGAIEIVTAELKMAGFAVVGSGTGPKGKAVVQFWRARDGSWAITIELATDRGAACVMPGTDWIDAPATGKGH